MRSSWIFGREQLGQRRAHGLQQGALAHEADIGVDRELGGGQDAHLRAHIVRIETQALAKPQPAGDAALLLAHAVMVEQADLPLAAQLAILAA